MGDKFTIISEVQTTFEHTKGQSTSKAVEAKVSFDLRDDNGKFSKAGYVDTEGLVNSQAGLKAQGGNLINGLLAGIHQGHQQGLWDSAEHLRWIIGHLESGFVAQVKVFKGTVP